MCSTPIEIIRTPYEVYNLFARKVMINLARVFPYSVWVSWNLVHCSRSSLLPMSGYMTLCETTIREIGLRRDQQSPYVVTQFSSGETIPRFNDFCDVLRAIFWNWSQFGVPVSLLVSIASRSCIIRVTSRASISLSFSLRRSEDLFSLRCDDRMTDGSHSIVSFSIGKLIDVIKKIFDL